MMNSLAIDTKYHRLCRQFGSVPLLFFMVLFASVAQAVVGPESTPIDPKVGAPVARLMNLDGTHRCGGALVENGIVLSASHCVGTPFLVQFPNSSDPEKIYSPKSIIKVDDLKVTNGLPSFTDLALFKLNSSPQITPISITFKSESDIGEEIDSGQVFLLVGYMNPSKEKNQSAPGDLRGGQLILNSIEPGQVWGNEVKLAPIENPSGHMTPFLNFASQRVWTVGGDSGSPLLCGQNFQQVCGVVSSTGIKFEDGRATSHYQFVSLTYKWVTESLNQLLAL